MIKTMKYQTANESQLEDLFRSWDWAMAVKFDGRGVLVGKVGGKPAAFNTLGQPVTWVPNLARMVENVEGDDILFRGELVRPPGGGYESGKVLIWDTPWVGGKVWDAPWTVRLHVAVIAARSSTLLEVVHIMEGTADKREAFYKALNSGAEGVVFFRKDGRYQPEKRVPQVLKHKFVQTADLAVTSFASETVDVNGYRHGVAIVVTKEGHNVGAVHVRQPVLEQLARWTEQNPGVPPILEVSYLYFTGSALVQPIAQKVRFDKMGDKLGVTGTDELRKSNLFV